MATSVDEKVRTGVFLLEKVRNMFGALDIPATHASLSGTHAARINEQLNELGATHLAQAIADLAPSTWSGELAATKLIAALASDTSLPATDKEAAHGLLERVRDSAEASALLYRYCCMFEAVLGDVASF